jgi:hypothetical protein
MITRMTTPRSCAAIVALAVTPVLLLAQGRSTLYSLSTLDAERGAPLFYGDVSYGERAFAAVGGERLEQLVGVQLALGHRLTLAARAGVATSETETPVTQQVELLRDVRRAPNGSIAAGLGATREYEGTVALFSRLAFARSWRSHRVLANAIVEKPLDSERDAVDVITSAAWMRGSSSGVQLGVEAVGQDLEGFWEPNEAEGGARLYIGPALTLPLARNGWRFTLAGGPVLHGTSSQQSSSASRPLSSGGFVFRARVSGGS